MNAPPLPGTEELYDAAPCGLLLATPTGQILHANTTVCRWLGYEKGELLEQARLLGLLTAGGRIFFQTHLQPLLRMQGSVSEVKLEVRRKDGTTLPMILNIVERPWNGASLWHVAAFIAEDRHKYERELVLQRKRAEDLAEQHARDQQEIAAARAQAEDRALFAEQLVGVVSHDIRNPLSVIHMSTVLLERGVSAEQQKPVIARVARAVTRMQHLITDLLDFTQARLGRGISVRPATVDLHQAVAEAVSELAIAFPSHAIRHVQAGTDPCHADPDRITQAIGNLVANAVNHGAAGQPVTVRTESGAQGFRIAVHNEGRPIPPELVPNLFEPMVRGESGTASKGVGLGLYIVREIARSHGGSVQVRSSEAEGTTFTIELPAASA